MNAFGRCHHSCLNFVSVVLPLLPGSPPWHLILLQVTLLESRRTGKGLNLFETGRHSMCYRYALWLPLLQHLHHCILILCFFTLLFRRVEAMSCLFLYSPSHNRVTDNQWIIKIFLFFIDWINESLFHFSQDMLRTIP